eukprot:1107833-Amorphochlora_amoeboformis.AAC.1
MTSTRWGTCPSLDLHHVRGRRSDVSGEAVRLSVIKRVEDLEIIVGIMWATRGRPKTATAGKDASKFGGILTA